MHTSTAPQGNRKLRLRVFCSSSRIALLTFAFLPAVGANVALPITLAEPLGCKNSASCLWSPFLYLKHYGLKYDRRVFSVPLPPPPPVLEFGKRAFWKHREPSHVYTVDNVCNCFLSTDFYCCSVHFPTRFALLSHLLCSAFFAVIRSSATLAEARRPLNFLPLLRFPVRLKFLYFSIFSA